MTAPSLITSTLCATLLMAGCASKQKTNSTASTGDNAGAATSKTKSAKTERATGEIQEAMIHLRRVHFAFDSDTLLPESRVALEEAGSRLRGFPKVHIYIDGHTDERGTGEYNLALGERRSRTVADYLTRLGITADRLHIMTYGEEKPWVAGASQESYGKNRRAEFRLMRGDVRLILDEGVYYDDRANVISRK